MAEAREELIVGGVGRTPPAFVLVVLIELVGARDIEWCDTHQTIGNNCPRVRSPEVGGADEGIDFIDESLWCLRP